jgi:hypothetical protein
MTADETMSEVLAAVAVAEAGRTGQVRVVAHDGASWHLIRDDSTLAGNRTLAVVLPGEDPMGIAKRILGAKMSGLCVPQAVLGLVGAERKPDPRPKPATKAAIAAAVSPPTPPPPVEPAPVVIPEPRPAPVPHEVRPPATTQRELW